MVMTEIHMQLSPAHSQSYVQPPSYFRRLNVLDWLFAAALAAGAAFALSRYGAHMDYYEKIILLAAVPTFSVLGWNWKPVRALMLVLAILALSAIAMYGGVLDMANKKFFLKYMLSSQSAILWMSALFFLSTLFYWGGLLARSDFGGSVGSKLCWAAVILGFTGMLVRWYESYLIGPDIGHIPVSNLYEVFVLFCMITALFYLYYEQHYRTRQLGAFVLLVISAAVGFLLWYTVTRDAADIQPLVPALQSWWMKIHVPANFIGYGTFSLAAMVGVAYLLKSKGYLVDRLPALEVLDDVMYKSIAVGFAFFTIATILGALWAADAWGGYWSWDPKETWALIVWLNYAAWLHMRLMKGLRGEFAAWWAVVGLLVTTFAFLGVNMFLSGLHSYGQL
jgi:cytochrome c-type biogenesis protein CcsB